MGGKRMQSILGDWLLWGAGVIFIILVYDLISNTSLSESTLLNSVLVKNIIMPTSILFLTVVAVNRFAFTQAKLNQQD